MIIRRTATILATAGAAACLTAPVSAAAAVSAPAARPADPAPPGLGILTGITLNAPVNLPVIACVNVGVTTGDPKDNPNDSCVSIPGKAGPIAPKGRS